MSKTKNLVHVNNNLICAVDIETTGTRFNWHEIIQAVFLPLDNYLNARKDLPVFDIQMRPDYIERIDTQSLEINTHQLNKIIEGGISQERGSDMFEHWFRKLKLPEGKRIIPLGHNVAFFDLPFIQSWLGNTMFNQYILATPRDTLTVANFLNDVADFHAEQVEFPKLKLSYIAHVLGIEVFEQSLHDPLYDCYLASQVYQKFINHHLLNPV